MLARKQQISSQKPAGWSTLEKSRLNQARALANRRQDYEELKIIDEQLKTLTDIEASENTGSQSVRNDIDVLAKLSEKNRRANSEAVRKAEIFEAERRRKERQLALSGKSGTATPPDPSARLRTIPRTMIANMSPSRLGYRLGCYFLVCYLLFIRSGTPLSGTPPLHALADNSERDVSPLPVGKSFESSVIASIDVDLGDF
jgi:RNA polymerase-associated protein RTF1